MQHSFTKKMHRMQYETIMYITVLLKKKKKPTSKGGFWFSCVHCIVLCTLRVIKFWLVAYRQKCLRIATIARTNKNIKDGLKNHSTEVLKRPNILLWLCSSCFHCLSQYHLWFTVFHIVLSLNSLNARIQSVNRNKIHIRKPSRFSEMVHKSY